MVGLRETLYTGKPSQAEKRPGILSSFPETQSIIDYKRWIYPVIKRGWEIPELNGGFKLGRSHSPWRQGVTSASAMLWLKLQKILNSSKLQAFIRSKVVPNVIMWFWAFFKSCVGFQIDCLLCLERVCCDFFGDLHLCVWAMAGSTPCPAACRSRSAKGYGEPEAHHILLAHMAHFWISWYLRGLKMWCALSRTMFI